MDIKFRDDDFELAHREIHLDKDEASTTTPFFKDVLKRFVANKGSLIGAIFIFIIIVLAICVPIFSQYTYDAVDVAQKNMGPRLPFIENIGLWNGTSGLTQYKDALADVYHFFGTDTLGRDLWVRTWQGARISLFVALAAVCIDICFGMVYGLISGYFGGIVDTLMQRIQEIINSIPTLVILTLLMIVMRPSLYTIIIALMITGWISMARITRAQVLKIKEQEFILASKTLGAGHMFIIFKEVLPNIFGQLIIMSMFSIPNAIFYEAFLAFVGLGIPSPQASLGTLINDGFKTTLVTPYMVIIPAVVLAILMLSFNLVADGLRDAFDPKMKEM